MTMLLAFRSGEQRQDAGMAVEAVARDLAIGEKADQREVAERLADHAGLHPRLAEQRPTASDAADIDAGFWRSWQTALQLRQHAGHVGASALGIAAAEQDLVTGRDFGADHH